MVRNLKGGNRHKKMARKNLNEDTTKHKTRLANPEEPCEMYATVTKMYGQGNCEVLCNDGNTRLCVIRNKFKGRNKSKNFIHIDTKVLVGLRDWELVSSDKKEKCDLLEVYERSQHNDIKYDPRSNWKLLATSVEKELIKEKENQPFEFIHSNMVVFEKEENKNGTTNVDELDFDAI
tara:strand:+ start:5125 stop:5655 length:531 start_codon:yes stop_codon:yes gene_type:complete